MKPPDQSQAPCHRREERTNEDAAKLPTGKEGVKAHPISQVFPMLSESDLANLSADIKEHGLRLPIIIHEGEILDGRNRFKACEMAGIEPRFETFSGDSSIHFVLSANLHRRHLSDSQKAAVAAELLPLLEREAKERLVASGKSTGRGRKKVVEQMPQPFAKSRDRAGAIVGVSGKYVSEVKAIREKSPEAFEQIKAGQKTISEVKRELIRQQRLTAHILRPTPDWEPIGADRKVKGFINPDKTVIMVAVGPNKAGMLLDSWWRDYQKGESYLMAVSESNDLESQAAELEASAKQLRQDASNVIQQAREGARAAFIAEHGKPEPKIETFDVKATEEIQALTATKLLERIQAGEVEVIENGCWGDMSALFGSSPRPIASGWSKMGDASAFAGLGLEPEELEASRCDH